MKSSEKDSEIYLAGLKAGYKAGQFEAIKCINKIPGIDLIRAFNNGFDKSKDSHTYESGLEMVRKLLIDSIK